MTEKELREKIAKTAYQYAYLIDDKDIDYRWENFGKKEEKWFYCADQILALVKEAGYVKLADDQSLPKNDWGDTELNRGWCIAQKEMLKAVWRKVKL